jgi:hypothetical protein
MLQTIQHYIQGDCQAEYLPPQVNQISANIKSTVRYKLSVFRLFDLQIICSVLT